MLLERSKVKPIEAIVEFASVEKWKEVRKFRRCYCAKVVARSTIGIASEVGVKIEVRRCICLYMLISDACSNVMGPFSADLFHWNSWTLSFSPIKAFRASN